MTRATLLAVLAVCACSKPEPLTTVLCSEQSVEADANWIIVTGAPFSVRYLPSSAAARDIERIIADRRAALGELTAKLGVAAPDHVNLTLTSSPREAIERGVGRGVTDGDTSEVLYLDAEDSFERVRFAHELTHVVDNRLDPDNDRHLPIVEEGLAELFASADDPHDVFVTWLRFDDMSIDEGIDLSRGVAADLSYAKAASLIAVVRTLNPSPERFARFFRNTAVRWSDADHQLHDLDGAVLTPKRARYLLNNAIWDAYNTTPNQFAERWLHYLRRAEPRVLRDGDDRAAIRNLFAVRDSAIEAGDPTMFRSTMEGFYCSGDEPDVRRATFAETMTMTPHSVRSRVRAVYDGGIKNYRRALVVLEQTAYGHARREQAVVEHYPEGWRVNVSSDQRWEPLDQ